MTNNVRWASATPREKAVIEEVARVTYERDRVRGSDCLCQKSALPLRHKRFDPHAEMREENTWSKVFPTSFFLRQKRPQSLIYQGWKPFCHLARMRSAVRIRPAAPKSIENFGSRCFFAAPAKTRSMVSFLMAQSSLSFPLSSIALVAAIKTADLLRTLAHLPGGWYNRGRE